MRRREEAHHGWPREQPRAVEARTSRLRLGGGGGCISLGGGEAGRFAVIVLLRVTRHRAARKLPRGAHAVQPAADRPLDGRHTRGTRRLTAAVELRMLPRGRARCPHLVHVHFDARRALTPYIA